MSGQPQYCNRYYGFQIDHLERYFGTVGTDQSIVSSSLALHFGSLYACLSWWVIPALLLGIRTRRTAPKCEVLDTAHDILLSQWHSHELMTLCP
jgi:hypothetical protein